MHFLFVYEDDEEAVREREECEFAIKFGKIAVAILLVIALFVGGVNLYKTYLSKHGTMTITSYCTSNTEHYDTDPDSTAIDHLEIIGLEEYEKYDGTTDKRWVVDYKD